MHPLLQPIVCLGAFPTQSVKPLVAGALTAYAQLSPMLLSVQIAQQRLGTLSAVLDAPFPPLLRPA